MPKPIEIGALPEPTTSFYTRTFITRDLTPAGWALTCIMRMLVIGGIEKTAIALAGRGDTMVLAVKVHGLFKPVYRVAWHDAGPAAVRALMATQATLPDERCDDMLEMLRDHLSLEKLGAHLDSLGITSLVFQSPN